MVNPSFRYARSTHDFYYTVMKQLGLDPFNITAHDVLGPAVHLMGGGGGQFWFSYCFTPTDDNNCLPEQSFFPIRGELRAKLEKKRKKRRAKQKQLQLQHEAGGEEIIVEGNVGKEGGSEKQTEKEKENEEAEAEEQEREKEQEKEKEEKKGKEEDEDITDVEERKEREGRQEDNNNSLLESLVERGQVFGFASAKKLRQLRPGMVVTARSLMEEPMRFTPAQIERMCLAEILVPLGYPDYQRKIWQKQIARAKAEMASVGYTVLRNLFPPLQLEAFRAYCRRRRDLDDNSDSSNGYIFKWKDAVATMFNCLLTKVIEEVTGESLIPIQSLILFYGEDCYLDVHLDWHPFAFSFSFAVDCYDTREPSSTQNQERETKSGSEHHRREKEDDSHKRKAWPLTMLTKASEPYLVDLELAFGEGVLFKGQELPHYRDRLPKGHSLISVSFSWDRKHRF